MLGPEPTYEEKLRVPPWDRVSYVPYLTLQVHMHLKTYTEFF